MKTDVDFSGFWIILSSPQVPSLDPPFLEHSRKPVFSVSSNLVAIPIPLTASDTDPVLRKRVPHFLALNSGKSHARNFCLSGAAFLPGPQLLWKTQRWHTNAFSCYSISALHFLVLFQDLWGPFFISTSCAVWHFCQPRSAYQSCSCKQGVHTGGVRWPPPQDTCNTNL